MAKLQRSLYEGAPGMLMDRIHEVNALLANSLLKTGQTESWKFWNRTSDIMKFAWDYMQNLNWVIKENYQLTSENVYLRDRLIQTEIRLNEYQTIHELKLMGTFEQRVELVDKLIESGVDKKEGIFRD